MRSLAIDACPDVIDVQTVRLPPGALHGPVTRTMMRRAVSRLGRGTGSVPAPDR
ncbi:hypothetical protein ACFS27_17405 [Promicromonospora vindobonensis]|uniref:Uncharacterized protein n=1 Tax=Promicromonospora vindobonensis TaxID=195748 RepID=A0ABW5VYC2_9MICO